MKLNNCSKIKKLFTPKVWLIFVPGNKFNINDMPLFVTTLFNGIDHNPLKSQKGVALQAGIKAVVPTLITKIEITS